MTTREMMDYSEQRARDDKRTAAATAQRTCYAIKLVNGNLYARANRSWSMTSDDALQFEFMTIANAHAILELGLAVEEYVIEPV